MTKQSTLEEQQQTSYLSGGSAAYLEELYEAYLHDPQSVDPHWQDCFAKLPANNGHIDDVSHSAIREQFLQLAKHKRHAQAAGPQQTASKQAHVLQFINAYRSHGHHHAKLDPLELRERKHVPDLDLGHHGLSHDDLSTTFSTHNFQAVGKTEATLKEIHAALLDTYCSTIGIEYLHITEPRETQWLQQRMETHGSRGGAFTADERKGILKQLTAAEGLAKYLANKYVGQKRFGLEGGESLIPMLHEIVQRSGSQGMKELVIGMAHRGRLNVLVNILGKAPRDLFDEFEGKVIAEDRSGDVKYHLGYSSDVSTPGGTLHLTLGFNPSHLEIISPVIEGSVRARQERRADQDKAEVLPVILHGDAAFAGQGVVMETFNMSQARGYCTGGTIHIVINNQIGFTTSNPLDARSTLYCTDVAKMVQAPIIHVNADDPDAVVFASQMALDYRMTFKKDVVLDLVCYRRHGHNESDEPSGTQPMMYRKIKQHKTVLSLYSERLVQEQILSREDADAMVKAYRDALDHGQSVVDLVPDAQNDFVVDWTPYLGQTWDAPADTNISAEAIQRLGKHLTTLPEDFVLQPQVAKEIESRKKMLAGEMPVFWGMGETLAYASLAEAGYGIRVSGQDCGRGTFAHRHAVLHHFENGNSYVPLQHISDSQGQVTIIDSILSEEAVMAFEYGYTSADPNSLVIWEGQFGDFANGAQVVIDQFISSADQKWGRLCGLVLLLPHGYEGMGPEHSSARLERYLQLCAEHNMQVCTPTTPAQCFHMLRRQMVRPFRKPLIVMSPKSLLRNKLATSSLDDFTQGKFHLVIPEVDDLKDKDVTRVIICGGKVYYDLLQKRRADELNNVAIVRIEQLYPFPEAELKHELARYKNAKEVVWCQEEPKNQGAWYCSQHNFHACLSKGQRLIFAGRPASAAPAVGYMSLHQEQQRTLIEDAFK